MPKMFTYIVVNALLLSYLLVNASSPISLHLFLLLNLLPERIRRRRVAVHRRRRAAVGVDAVSRNVVIVVVGIKIFRNGATFNEFLERSDVKNLLQN